jgi:hypothetical protein
MEKITYFDSRFHGKSSNIIFMLLACIIISLFRVKVENFVCEKSLNEAILLDIGISYNTYG